jgi:hypothetical protein
MEVEGEQDVWGRRYGAVSAVMSASERLTTRGAGQSQVGCCSPSLVVRSSQSNVITLLDGLCPCSCSLDARESPHLIYHRTDRQCIRRL